MEYIKMKRMINMNNQTIVIYRLDKTFGGYDYLEFSPETQTYVMGNSRSHQGHGYQLTSIEVSTLKELRKQVNILSDLGYYPVETFARSEEHTSELQSRF